MSPVTSVQDPRDEPAQEAVGNRPDGRRERWRHHREARRRELVRAVIAAVRDEGHRVGMEDIAEHSGVAKQVFYRYFSDKADLHAATGQAVAAAVVRDIAAAIESTPDAHDMLAAGIGRYLELVESDVALYRYVMHPTAADRRDKSAEIDRAHPVSDFETAVGLRVTRLVGDRMREAGFDAGAAEPWSFALVGAARAATDRWLVTQSMSREALGEYLTEFAWSGLSAVGSKSAESGPDGAADGAEVEPLAARPTGVVGRNGAG